MKIAGTALTKINVYLNGEKVDIKHNIGNKIIDLSLKKGDIFEYLSFNHFDDEDTKYKGDKLPIHSNLTITDIKYQLIESWNSSIKTIIDIFLTN